MKFGERHEFEVERVDAKGRGIGTVDGKPAATHFAIPGERVEGRFVGRAKGTQRFDLARIITPSPDRVEPPCPHAGTCGGCAWQHVDYPRQLELKRWLVNHALEEHEVPLRIDAVQGSPSLFGYRNRMDYCVGPDGEVGLKQPGRWNAYVDLETCLLLSDGAVKAMDAFRGWMRENDVRAWDPKRHEGYARYLVIREGKRTGQRLLLVVTAEGDLPAKDDLLARFEGLETSVIHGVNPEVTDISIPDRLAPLSGDPWIEEEVAGLRFRIPPASFFQTNTEMAERLLAAVRDRVRAAAPETLLDLYCGVGFLGIGCAADAGRVFGYELDEAAAAVATGNAERNGVKNAEFHAGKAEALLWEAQRPDMVIIDPPRAGLHPRVITTLLERLPERIVYVSCNHRTFAKDHERFTGAYRLSSLEAFDLFPHTPHVELVGTYELRH